MSSCQKVVLAALVLASSLCGAQSYETPTKVTDQNRTGELPFSSSIGTDAEAVDLGSGSLNVTIPVFSAVGRQMPYNFKLLWRGLFWYAAERNTTAGVYPSWRIERRLNLTTGPGWQINRNYMTWTTTRQQCSEPMGGDTGTVSTAEGYLLQDGDGAKHRFGVEAKIVGGVVCEDPPGEYLEAESPDVDGTSGMLARAPGIHSTPAIYLSDGTQVAWPEDNRITNWNPNPDLNVKETLLGAFLDTNGNQKQEYPGGLDTLGRALVTEQRSSTQIVYWIKDANGTAQAYTVNLTPISLQTNFGVQHQIYGTIAEGTCTACMAVSSIVLPNGRSYSFQYDAYGMVSRIDLPTGAYVTYAWGNFSDKQESYRYVINRTVVEGGQSRQWSITRSCAQTSGGMCIAVDVSVTDPLNQLTTYRLSRGKITLAKIYTLNSLGQQTLLRQHDMTYAGAGEGLLASVQSTLDNGLVSRSEYDYTGVYLKEMREFGYGSGVPGSLQRRTRLTYLHADHADPAVRQAYAYRNIVNKVIGEIVDTGVGTAAAAESRTTYDQYSGFSAFESSVAAPQHDATGHGSAFTYRGNATKVERWRNKSSAAMNDPAWLATDYKYDVLGNLRAVRDPGEHVTTWSYGDSWYGSACPPTANSQAYVTDAANHLSQHILLSYQACTGQVRSRRDQNDVNNARAGTTYLYDSMNRVTKVDDASGGQTSTTYNDSTLPLSSTVTVKQTASTSIVTTTVVDGLGRTKKTKLTSDPQGTVFSFLKHDGLGRKAEEWNPSRCDQETNPSSCAGENTFGLTAYKYDALGRVTKLVPPDGTAVSNNVRTFYSGECTTVFDQAGKQRRSCTDALGRLVQVEEPDTGQAAAVDLSSVAGVGAVTWSGAPQSTSVQTQAATQATGTVTISGSPQSANDPDVICPPSNPNCNVVWDSGTVSVTVNGMTKSSTYNRFSTTSGIASNLRNAFNNDAARTVNASVSGSVITFTAIAYGPGGNGYALSTASTSNRADLFSPSFWGTRSGATLTGGQNAAYGTVWDSGTASITVNGLAKTVSWNSSSTASSIATALRDAFNGDASSPVTASATGGVVTLTSKTTGASTNYALASAKNWNTAYFGSSSFSGSNGAALSGGADSSQTAPALSNPYVTLYAYDVLGNLTSVQQKGGSANSAEWRARAFTYNSLSQLLSASNPESGTISYSYDLDGNVKSKDSPAPNQLSAAVRQVVSHCYDGLHRLTGKKYAATVDCQPSAAASWDVEYRYDQTSYNGLTIANGTGRRTGMRDSSGQTAWSFDSMGQVLTERRTIAGVTKSFSQSYNLDGSLASLTYPSGRVVSFAYNAAGRSLSAIDSDGTQYASAASYLPTGALSTVKYGAVSGGFAGITLTNSYNKRLQPVFISASTPTQTVLSLGYGFGLGVSNNGNVLRVDNNRDSERSQSFTYDPLNRIASAQSSGTSCTLLPSGITKNWGTTFNLDAWGNLLARTVTKCSADGLAVSVGLNNRLNSAGFSYDAAGNLTQNGAAAYVYDAENRLSSTAGVSYSYDGDGVRVKRSNGTLYWGELAESDLAGNISKEFVFFGGERTARRDASTGAVHYFISDHLGSANVVTSATGTIEEESDFYPYGAERVITDTLADQHRKFTDQERDPESGCDYFIARHYCSTMGRFMQADEFSGGPVSAYSSNDPAPPGPLPYADITNPQSLNKYSYTWNNPTNMVDPDGHDAWDFLSGAANAFVHDFTVGAAPRGNGNADYQVGQTFGDAAAAVVGTIQALEGAAIAGGGIAVSGTGAGTVVGAPAAAAGAVVATHGAATALTALGNLTEAAFAKSDIPDKPPGENKAAQRGREAHANYDPGPGFEKNVTLPSGKRVDAVNKKTAVVKELKPNNKRAVKKGQKQAESYRKELQKHDKKKRKWKSKVETY